MQMGDESISYHQRPRWHWRFLLVCGPAALAFGTWGQLLCQLANGGHAHFSRALYRAVQMFVLDMPDAGDQLNLPLEVGLWLAAATSGLAVVLLFQRVFQQEWRRFRLRWIHGHVVVCGLGEVGRRLAIECRRSGLSVVAIEQDETSHNIVVAEREGVTVLVGDATQATLLRDAGVRRADTILAVCTADDTNVAIAVAAEQELARCPTHQASATGCFLLIGDPLLRDQMKLTLPAPGTGVRFALRIGGLDVPDVAARKALELYPLDFLGISRDHSTQVHLVLVGADAYSKALALKALQVAHFANRKRLSVTLAGTDAQAFLVDLRRRHSHTAPWYDAVAINRNILDPSLPADLVARLASEQYVTVVVCGDDCTRVGENDDARNLSLALQLEQVLRVKSGQVSAPARMQMLVHLRNKSGFGALLDRQLTRDEAVPMHAFGLVQALSNRATLLNEQQDRLAKSLHAEYLAGQDKRRIEADAEKTPWRPHAAYRPWEELPEAFRESNRHAADHLPVKLRALGLHMGAEGEPNALTSFDVPDDTLTAMEHERWCAEHWLSGWQLGERDDGAKRHPDLVPWERLADPERRIDRHFVAQTVSIAQRAGMSIYRTHDKHETRV